MDPNTNQNTGAQGDQGAGTTPTPPQPPASQTPPAGTPPVAQPAAPTPPPAQPQAPAAGHPVQDVPPAQPTPPAPAAGTPPAAPMAPPTPPAPAAAPVAGQPVPGAPMPPPAQPPAGMPPAGMPMPGAGMPPAGMPGAGAPTPPPQDDTPANFQLGTLFKDGIKLTLQAHPETKFEDKYFVDLLAGSISLSKSEKKRIIDAIPNLKQWQIDELVNIFEEEKKKFAQLSQRHVPQLKKLEKQHYEEWCDIELEQVQTGKVEEDKSKADEIRKNLGL